VSGVRGTPTIFINGKKVKNRSMPSMEALISEELKDVKSQEEKAATQ